MGILLKSLRIFGFRGVHNVEIDLEPTTVMVGTNNAGKTTILRALQLALSNSYQVTNDDFFYSEDFISEKIIIDLLFISVDEEGVQNAEFEDKWSTVFTDKRISFDSNGYQIVAFRTLIEENLIRKSFSKRQFVIDEWGGFDNDGGFWYQIEYKNSMSFYFEEIPYFYLDANRDILDDLKYKTSFLGKILSSIEYKEADKIRIENLIKELNNETIRSSEVLANLHKTLIELDTAMDNPDSTVDITPFTKKLRDLSKGMSINYSQFSMEYHGMGTRSWSSLLVMKAFISQNERLANKKEVAYFPIIAIEEPESHLHPNAQKKLYSQIDTFKGQRMVATHSSYIAGNAALKEIRSITKMNDKSIIGKVLINELNDEEIRKIVRHVVNTRGELYFSKAVIFCEGETEEQALPLLIKKFFGKSVIELGVDVIGISGGGNYFPFMYFAESFNLKWFILSDGENPILKKLKKDYKKLMNLETPVADISLPDNILYFEDEDDFESYLMKNGFAEEVEACLKTVIGVDDLDKLIARKNGTIKGRVRTDDVCETCSQNIFIDQTRNYDGSEGRTDALNDLLSDNKTKYPSILSQLIFDSKKELPPKITELFEKINQTFNKDTDEHGTAV